MKQLNLWLFAGLFAAVFTLSACGGDDDTNEPPMDAAQWYETPELIVKSGVEEDKKSSTNFYISTWKVNDINEHVLTVKIKNDTFNLAKQ